MSTSVEQTLFNSIAAAEGVRQTAYAAALATWAFQQGTPFTTYKVALAAADQAYYTAVVTAAGIANLSSKAFGSGPWPATPGVSPYN